jgi:CubicO group peptidase (beta-lactamase class C family)
MLLNEGELDGVRLLRPETVRLMTTNQLPSELVPVAMAGPNHGWGFGWAVSVGEHGGAYRWVGISGTTFWVDPEEDLIAFAWDQLRPSGGAPIERILSDIVYGAIRD